MIKTYRHLGVATRTAAHKTLLEATAETVRWNSTAIGYRLKYDLRPRLIDLFEFFQKYFEYEYVW